ncbi:MAG: hypothetical protein RBU23_10265 [Candidatus Auribacterota bacterium]|nr:hypothetical protein [Candidatus Auribacterota bacterium]
MHILIVTKDTLPAVSQFCLPDSMRLWGIGEGLKKNGYDITYLMPETNYGVQGKRKCTGRTYYYRNNTINSIIDSFKPDMLIAQDWKTSEMINCKRIPMAIDLAGIDDHVTCNISDQIKKIRVLQKGDLFLCASEQQKWFYINWLMQSGFDMAQDIVKVVPNYYQESFVKKVRKTKCVSRNPVFLTYWDNYVSKNFSVVSRIINMLSVRERGYYNILSGVATYENDIENFLNLYNSLSSDQDCFSVNEIITWKELRESFYNADVAIFLEQSNMTSQMGIPDRAIQYMCAGLPIVCSKGTLLAQLIEQYGAGWVVDVSDADEIFSCINSLINYPESIQKARSGVSDLLADKVFSIANIQPVSDYCRNIKKATRKDAGIIGHLLDFSHNVVNIQNPLLNDMYIENILVMVSGSWSQLADCLDMIDIMFPLSNITLLCPDSKLIEDMEITADCELIIYENDVFSPEDVTGALLQNDTERFDLGIALFDNQFTEDNTGLKNALLASGAKYKVGFTCDQNFVLLEDSIEKCIAEVLDTITQTSGSINP